MDELRDHWWRRGGAAGALRRLGRRPARAVLRGRRRRARALGLVLAAPALVALAPPAGAQDVSLAPPNIVFVLTDDLSWNLVRHMPAVRQLRSEGVTFSNYIVSNSLCCPSRATILTGRLPHNTGVETNLPPFGGYQRYLSSGNAESTFATSLKAAGYRTALMGKILNGYVAERDGAMTGFDEWQAVSLGYRGYDYVLNDNGHPVGYGRSPEAFLNTVLTRKAEAFIATAAADRTPFLLEVASFTPHFPYAAAEQDRGLWGDVRNSRAGAFGKSNRGAPTWLGNRAPLTRVEKARMDRVLRRRVASVQAVDRMLTSLRASLQAAGIADNTYVVFSSDNGFHTGEHRLLPGKQTAFDHDVRVPLVIAGPGVATGGSVTELTQNTDLRPTFEGLAGIPAFPDVDGISLLPWLRDPGLEGTRGAALIEHLRQEYQPSVDPDAQGRGAGSPPDYTALRLPEATYVEYITGEREYYDLLADPDQLDNDYGSLSDLERRQLTQRLAALAACVGPAACTAP